MATQIWVDIGSGNGLWPVLLQAITWAIDDQNLSYHIASLGHSELKQLGFHGNLFTHQPDKILWGW